MIGRSFRGWCRLTAVVLLAWFAFISFAGARQEKRGSGNVATYQVMEAAVLPLVEPRPEVQPHVFYCWLFNQQPQLVFSRQGIAGIFQRGLSVNPTASNPFYVNLRIHAP